MKYPLKIVTFETRQKVMGKRHVIIQATSNEMDIRPDKSERWPVMIVSVDVSPPKRMRQKIFWHWFDEDAIVIPEEMETWSVGYDNYTTAYELVMERRNMGAVWCGDKEEPLGEVIKLRRW
jgi:hypothetical protein